MKKIVLASLLSACLIPAFAQAADATITFTGDVVAQTCAINSADKNITVALPKVGTSALTAVGQTAGTTPFQLRLTGCTAVTDNTVTGMFEVGANVDTATGRLNNTGTAKNVQINLLDDKLAAVSANRGLVTTTVTPRTVPEGQTGTETGGTGTFDLYAQYYATGAAEAGTVNSSVQFTLVYQ